MRDAFSLGIVVINDPNALPNVKDVLAVARGQVLFSLRTQRFISA